MPKIDLADLGITALGIALAYLVINAALAGALLEAGNPAASVRWWPGYPQAGVMIAEKRLSAADVPGALKAADWALERQPLNVAAMRVAGLAIERRAGTAQAEPLMRLAAQRSWRDAPTTAWVLKRDLIERRVGGAVDDVDAMLRLTRDDPSLQTRLISLLAIASNLPPFVPPLVRRLTQHPPWRGAYLGALGGWQQGQTGADAVFTALRRSDAPPTGAEIAPYISRLVNGGEYAAALERWRALSPAAVGEGAQLLHDGDFAAPVPDGTPLDWVMNPGSGGSSMIGPLPGAPNGRGLRIEYDGVSQAQMPRQLLVLQPGAYRLTGAVSTEAPAPGSGLRWSLTCAASHQTVAQSSAFGGTSGPAAVALDFTVAPNCVGLWLTLTPDPGERASDMIVWFSNLAVHPVSAAAAPNNGPTGATQAAAGG